MTPVTDGLYTALKEELAALKAENERLKEENDELNTAYKIQDELNDQLQADKAELLEALKSCKQEVMFQSSGYARQVYIICDLLLSKHEAK